MLSFIFPGQGSQYPGMGKALCDAYPTAQATFDEADEALGMKLSALCFEGSEADLKQTEVTQPAIMAHSVAVTRVLHELRPDFIPAFVAGHSLGEWSALVTISALAFPDALRLVQERGRQMQIAVPHGQGRMAACLGLTRDKVEAALAEVDGEVWCANFNASEQIAVSGRPDAVLAAERALEAAGAKKVVDLPVSAPFHCPLMQPAADGLAKALEPIEVRPLAAPMVTNVEAAPNQDASRVKELLVEQVTHPVRWVECFTKLAEMGAKTALELGPGKVLKGLGRRIDRNVTVIPVADPKGLEDALAHLDD